VWAIQASIERMLDTMSLEEMRQLSEPPAIALTRG
jgi:hypothetical protein